MRDGDNGSREIKEKGVAEDEILDSITNSMDMNLSKLQETAEGRGAWGGKVLNITWWMNNNADFRRMIGLKLSVFLR